MAALQLQTVRFKEDSYRTILVSPDITEDVFRKDFYVREVKVGASPKAPLLSVLGFGEISITAGQRVVLSESHMLVDDADTLDSDDNLDASKIKFRVTGLTGGTLQTRASDSDPWSNLGVVLTTQYREFSLADLRGGLVSLKASSASSLSPIEFSVQAVDDGDPDNPGSDKHLSDSDPVTDGAQVASVSIRVVALERVAVGRLVDINGDGALTPDQPTLDAWRAAATPLTIFVKLYIGELLGGKNGIVDLSVGDVDEHLSVGTHNVPSSRISVSWSNGTLSLRGTSSATTADFMAILNVLQLQTVHFGAVSTRTIVVEPDASVARAGYYARDLEVEASVDPLLVVDFKDVRVDSGQHLILTEDHILVDDMDTRDPLDDTKVDASKIKFRITGLTGGTLWTRASDSDPWLNVAPTPSTQYQEFSLADLKAGKIAFLAGDGQSTGDGKTIDFSIQAVDDDLNLSDSDLSDDDADPIEVNIFIVATARTVAGIGARINTDGLLTPSPTMLGAWQQSASTYSGTLYVIVKLMGDLVDGDKLSLQGSYDTSEITPVWDEGKGELSLKVESSATVEDIRTALDALWLDTALTTAASTREIWVFPTLGSHLAYRLDESADLVRYYYYDGTARSFSAASTQAEGRTLFGKSGYLGVYTSDTEKSIYTGFGQNDIFLAISDDTTEGEWVITSGPRAGELFWDHGASGFGSGAQDPGWISRGDFWHGSEPNGGNGGRNENYAKVDTNGRVYDIGGGNRKSVTQFDLLLSEGSLLTHKVNVAATPPNPILSVDMGEVRLLPGERLVLTESHLSVRDVDTLDNGGNVDASKIKFRITGLTGAELHELSAPDTWNEIVPQGASPNTYQEFSLADLKAEKISLEAGDGQASGDGVNIAFQIQAVDDTPNLSDSNPDVVGDDPAEVEIEITLPIKVASGIDSLINADHALTPSVTTLGAWKTSASTYSGTLHVVVKLMGLPVNGDTLSLQSGYDASKVTPGPWDGSTGELSLEFDSSATPADMRAALGKLSLDTTLSLSSSTRKIWIFPTLPGLSHLKYRLDESTDLVRYYFYDSTRRTFSEASTEAAGRTLFGKGGYLGMYTSNAEKAIYKTLWTRDMHLGLTDKATEGSWVITAGPRAGELLWNNGTGKYGAGITDWSSKGDFWKSGEPDNWKGRRQ